jgi:hypothetical protein
MDELASVEPKPYRDHMKAHRLLCIAFLLATGLIVPHRSAAERHISEESLLFRRLRGGVVTVFGDEGQGSGFLVDSAGIILTNDHVVGTSKYIRVKLDDSTRVEAVLLTSDPKKDVAALLINPDVAHGRTVLPLATPSDTMLVEGEKVLALGSPLHQEAAMTTGIVSKVQPTAIISDVNLNHGNSGGPLVNMDGEVVGINTFGDLSAQGGPGISGSINIAEATSVLHIAHINLATTPAPSARRLALPPRTAFPLDSLQSAVQVDDFNSQPYDVTAIAPTGKFEVAVSTPVFQAWREHRFEVELAKNVHRREQQGNAGVPSTFDPLRDMREWMRYTGHDYVPVVTFQITPKSGETGASVFGNLLGAALVGPGYRGTHVVAFRSDFKDIRVMRDSVDIEDVGRARVMVPLAFAHSTWSADYVGRDMARVGIWQCSADCFRPEANGKTPSIEVAITSVENPEKPTRFRLPEETIRRIWRDFSAYRRLTGTYADSLEYKTRPGSREGNQRPGSSITSW